MHIKVLILTTKINQMMMTMTFSIIILLSSLSYNYAQILYTHSHNDYEQGTPLYTALELSYNSIEVDIVAFKNELVVSHDDKNLTTKPRLDKAYLNKIQDYFSMDSMSYENPLILLIDIKEYSDMTLVLLDGLLKKYDPLLMNIKSTEVKPLQVILSGEIPRKSIIHDKRFNYFFIDGRITDLHKNYNSFLMPWISMNFSKLTKWNGINNLSLKDELKIKNKIYQVQKQNKKIRFWKSPDHENVWDFLYRKKVNIIGTDDLTGLELFLKSIEN